MTEDEIENEANKLKLEGIRTIDENIISNIIRRVREASLEFGESIEELRLKECRDFIDYRDYQAVKLRYRDALMRIVESLSEDI